MVTLNELLKMYKACRPGDTVECYADDALMKQFLALNEEARPSDIRTAWRRVDTSGFYPYRVITRGE